MFSRSTNIKQAFLIVICILFAAIESYFFTYNITYFFAYMPWLLFSLFIALHFNRSALLIRDFLVFSNLFLLFNFLRGVVYLLIKHYNLPVHSNYIIEFERLFISSGSLASVLQHQLTEIGSVSWIERICVFIYSSHFACFIVVALLIWAKKAKELWRYQWALLSCAFIGLVFYFILPTTPPWLAFEKGLIPPVRNIFHEIMQVKFGELLKLGDTNPVAAMPSLHVAFPFIALLSLTHHFKLKQSWPFLVYFLLVIFSTLLLGAHYIGDVFAGMLLAYGCHYVTYFKLKANNAYTATVSLTDIAMQFGIVIMLFILQMLIKVSIRFLFGCA